jgi:hypothetical protein
MSHRDLRLLQAVADGRVECTGSVEPDFFVDGVACCDHPAARALARAGLVRPTRAADPCADRFSSRRRVARRSPPVERRPPGTGTGTGTAMLPPDHDPALTALPTATMSRTW